MEVACESTVWILFGLRLFIMTAVAGPSHRHSNDKTQKTSSIRSTTTTTTKLAMIIIINWQIEWNSWTGKCREHWDGFFFSSDSRKSLNLLQRALATAAAATKWRCVLASFELLRHRNSLDIVVPNGNDNDINVVPSEHCTSQFSSLPVCVCVFCQF